MWTSLIIVIDGVTYGAWLFLVALGLTLIFGVMKILNIAHGNFYAAGAYVAATAMGYWFANHEPSYLAFVIQLVTAVVTGVLLGVLLEVTIVRRLRGRDEVSVALATFALLLMMDDAMQFIWGAAAYPAPAPYGLLGTSKIAGLRFNNYEFALVGLAILVGGAVCWLLMGTRTGRSLKALIYDREMAAAMGVPVDALYLVIFTLGAVLAALGGAFTAPMIQVAPGLGAEIIVLIFAVIVIGGMGSILGAAVGALLVGLARSATIHLYPFAEVYIVYVVMALVLAFRPEGLFPPAKIRKI
ncbi:branched-chain amino acid ABC transporter permease [Bradyrhizobium sp. sBnM-33]|uniref:branched-chain amino acid ABC transporter permease n=1 Tax=Bradyrhizobium sp. sBnM-33 TaxID=2831780 RepID=UPI001BCA931E|nr:branched-chain amino acid ABC transporter permease [Bradyrhizobium sp. sBnM-33]WOH53388.1 branched-chain amino acid ABC transporter permease [Bradyrhizobium sp. sBnM-33]